MMYLFLTLILIRGLLMANENIVVEEKDGIKTFNYYNGETPSSGTVGNLVEIYDGCNVSTKLNNGGAWTTTLMACHFADGQTVNTWEKYQITEIEFVVIHDSYIYHDYNLKKW